MDRLVCAFAATFAPSFGALLALRFVQGMGAAGTRVIATAVVRDRYSGREMAEIMSLTFMVFMAIPILAPNSSGGAKTGDGQVCVTHGVFGMGPEAVGRAPGRYGSVARALYDAAAQYLADIQGDQSVIPTAAPADRR